MRRPYPALSQNDKDLIVSTWHTTTRPADELIEILGVSRRSFFRVLREAGINTKRRNRYTLREMYFWDLAHKQPSSPAAAYSLGLMMSDGCVTNSNYIAFQSTDPELTNWLKQRFRYTGQTREIQTSSGRTAYRINFSSALMARDLRSLGVIPRKTYEGGGSFWGWNWRSFLLGYFDGDGCAWSNPKGSGGVIHLVGTRAFVEDLRAQLGRGRVVEGKGAWYWKLFARSDFEWFRELIYADADGELGLQRKKDDLDRLIRNYKSETRWSKKAGSRASL